MKPSSSKRLPMPTERVLLLFALIVACILMIAVGVWAAQPYRDAAKTGEKNAVLEAELLRTTRKAEAARRDSSLLQSPVGIMYEAQLLGYVRQGQVPLIIPGNAKPAAGRAPVTAQ